MSETWINTYGGKKFYPLNPRIEDIDIIDIAHSLSMICRFTGHTQFFYGVGQHSVLVSYNCEPTYAKYGLLHDASEYALSDFCSVLKRHPDFENYRKYEKQLQTLIYTKFGLDPKEPANVKYADLRMLSTEARDLLPNRHEDWKDLLRPYDFKINPLQPQDAEQLFLNRFIELFGELNKWQ